MLEITSGYSLLGKLKFEVDDLKKFVILLVCICMSLPVWAQAKPRSGFLVKGGLWGLGGQLEHELEDKNFVDDLIFGANLNLPWSDSNEFYLLHPIGLEYYMGGIGPGSLLLGLDFRGFPSLDLTGFTPNYDYNSISSATFGIHTAELDFKNIDFVIGYQMAFQQFLITPKFSIRDFRTDFQQSGFYLGDNFGRYRESSLKASTWVSYLGVNLEFVINKASTVFLELGFTSPILGQFGDTLSLNSLEYSEFSATSRGSASISVITDGTQEISGNLFDLGYQHSFSALALRIGYRTETLTTSYPGYTHVSISGSSGSDTVSFSEEEIVSDLLIYRSDDSSKFSSLYFMLTYQF